MIIQRIAQSFRKQDWGTLVIELVVVVVGIFLGLQVDDWNEARKEARQEVIYLERLLADAGDMIAEHEAHEVQARDKIEYTIDSLNALRTCQLTPQTEQSFQEVLLNHQGLARIPVIRATYDEMVSSGALTRIRDQALKKQISDTFAFAEIAQDFVSYFTADLGRASSIIWKHVAFNIRPDAISETSWDGGWRGEGFSQSVSYDFEALCQSPEFINAMVEVFDSAKDRLGTGAEFAGRLATLREMLLTQLDGTNHR